MLVESFNCDDESTCDICNANSLDENPQAVTMDIYMYNPHCQELRRNRVARKNKIINPRETVF